MPDPDPVRARPSAYASTPPGVAWIAVVVATVGLGALSLQGFAVGLGETLTLASAALYALHIVGLGAWSTAKDVFGLSVLQMVVIAAVFGLGALLGGVVLPQTPGDWVAMVYMALVARCACPRRPDLGPGPPHGHPRRCGHDHGTRFAASFAVLLGGEVPTARMLVGGALVLTAMYVVGLGPRRGRDAG